VGAAAVAVAVGGRRRVAGEAEAGVDAGAVHAGLVAEGALGVRSLRVIAGHDPAGARAGPVGRVGDHVAVHADGHRRDRAGLRRARRGLAGALAVAVAVALALRVARARGAHVGVDAAVAEAAGAVAGQGAHVADL